MDINLYWKTWGRSKFCCWGLRGIRWLGGGEGNGEKSWGLNILHVAMFFPGTHTHGGDPPKLYNEQMNPAPLHTLIPSLKRAQTTVSVKNARGPAVAAAGFRSQWGGPGGGVSPETRLPLLRSTTIRETLQCCNYKRHLCNCSTPLKRQWMWQATTFKSSTRRQLNVGNWNGRPTRYGRGGKGGGGRVLYIFLNRNPEDFNTLQP